MSTLIFFAAALALLSGSSMLFFLESAGTRIAARRLREATRVSGEALIVPRRWEQIGRWIANLLHRLRVRLGMSETATLSERILRAGYRSSQAADIYIAARLVGPVAGLITGSAIASNRGFWMICFAGIAYLLPDMLLQHLVRRHRERIRLSLPDTVDLLVICVEAGLGLDQALLRVAQELGVAHPEITAELLQINREQRAGKPRVDAWQDMANRVDLPDLRAFVNMLTQTERFGTPIAKALSNFSEGLRLKRRQSAEEKAAKTTVKIIFPLVLCIFPSLFIVLLGPAALTISRGIKALGQ